MAPELVESLVTQLESKDHSTAAHTWRVVLYARALAEQFEVDADRLESITIGAALHDVGKLDIPTPILTKPGPLTHDEFAIIKQHPVLGFNRLVSLGETDPLVLGLVRSHHERVDGRGYPDGLAAGAIPPPARYFAVIDTFDALTSVRPYRSEVGPAAAEHAIEELHRGVGSRYCDECVDAFVRLYRRGELKWILEYYNDRCDLPYAASRAARASTLPRNP
jgi:HD-GYP domain-containing protein (c-di-GMP phosphodiesterase class II)